MEGSCELFSSALEMIKPLNLNLMSDDMPFINTMYQLMMKW